MQPISGAVLVLLVLSGCGGRTAPARVSQAAKSISGGDHAEPGQRSPDLDSGARDQAISHALKSGGFSGDDGWFLGKTGRVEIQWTVGLTPGKYQVAVWGTPRSTLDHVYDAMVKEINRVQAHFPDEVGEMMEALSESAIFEFEAKKLPLVEIDRPAAGWNVHTMVWIRKGEPSLLIELTRRP